MKNLIIVFFALIGSYAARAQHCCTLERDFTVGFELKEKDSAGLFFNEMMGAALKYKLDTITVRLVWDHHPDMLVTVLTARGGFESLMWGRSIEDWPCSTYDCPKVVIMSQDEKTLLRLIYKSDKENPYD